MYIKPEDITLYTDENIIIINKPNGLLTLPDRYDPNIPYVQNILEPHYGKLWIVHRLDKGTSGIMILARDMESHQKLNRQFQNRQVKKVYHALVYGIPEWTEKKIKVSLVLNGDRYHRTIVDTKKGKPSETQFLILDKYIDSTLIEAQPKTGYTHQIRCHLAYCGLPILGDELYGNIPINKHFPIKRLFLHAYSIQLEHPATQKIMNFTADYPKEFVKAVRRCKTHSL